jgi:histidyl-tRNA synthetase
MAAQKPGLARGTRDFGPVQMSRRNYLFGIIRAVFEKFGVQPLETPAIENLATLTGKYGDEGDQLLFKVLDSGDFFEKAKPKIIAGKQIEKFAGQFVNAFNRALAGLSAVESSNFKNEDFFESYVSRLRENSSAFEILDDRMIFEELISEKSPEVFLKLRYFKDFDLEYPFLSLDFEEQKQAVTVLFSEWALNKTTSKTLATEISEKGLRYDLTVPFARYVVMNQHLHTFPFKRYQIQPVWRADRPQKGRYREFFQCDADVVGTNSLLCEAEIVLMIKEVFEKLGLADYSIKLNNRKILSGIAELMGAPGKEGPLCVAIDKLDKIGEEKVFEELKERGFGNDTAEKLKPFLQLSGSNATITGGLEKLLAGSEVGMQGLAELKEVMIMVEGFGIKVDQLAIDPTLARGLSYDTGCIFEVKPTSVQMGSICGGGRYDDLTGMFGLPNVSGVGISFGIDRIYDVLDELNLFPAESVRTSKVLIANFDEASARKSLAILSKLREAGIAAELYPESAKLKKQFTYAESKGIPFLLMAGESEFTSGEFGLKNLQSGEQKTYTIDQIISELR